MTLNEIKPGEKAIILSINTNEDIKRRFQDIGIIENTIVECIGKSPAGDPKAYIIRGAVIAIRSDDGKKISVVKKESWNA